MKTRRDFCLIENGKNIRRLSSIDIAVIPEEKEMAASGLLVSAEKRRFFEKSVTFTNDGDLSCTLFLVLPDDGMISSDVHLLASLSSGLSLEAAEWTVVR